MLNLLPNLVIRNGPPNEHDELPFGTLCKSGTNDNSIHEYWIQLNKEGAPRWQLIGLFDSETPLETIKANVEKILNG